MSPMQIHSTKAAIRLEEFLKKPWRLMEWSLAVAILWVAFVLFLPEATFERSKTYNLMKDLGSELEWSALLAAVGFLHVYALWRGSWWGRMISNIITSTAFGTISVCFFIGGGPATTGAGIYAILAANSLFAGMRLAFIWRKP